MSIQLSGIQQSVFWVELGVMFVVYGLHLQGLMIQGFNSMFVFGRAILLGLFMVLVLGLKARVNLKYRD